MKRKALFTFLIIVLLYAPLAAAETVRFAYPAKSLNYLPLVLGKDKGIYQAEGIGLELIQVASMISAKALMTGDLEFSGAQAQVLGAAAKGLPVKIVAFITVKPSFWLVSKPEIRSITDLKGKIIGTTAIGSSTDTLARYLIKKHGLVPDKEVALFATGTTANILAALKGGSVDAGMLSPPFHAMAKILGFRILAYLGDYVEQSLSGIGTSEKLLRERPEAVKKVIRATLKSMRFVRQNREETVQYIAKEWKVGRPLAEELYLSMIPAFSPDGSMAEKGIRDTLEREREKLEIKEEIPLSRVIDLRLLKQAQKEF
ncbi:MAG: ABC transporter substrate-binding protein [Deltaproteobacteria bacterium]|nr:ABC transporter substrate-binding protein [Deltaproteobacteria bacterium]